MKPFDTYPEDRAQLLKLAAILEHPDDHSEEAYRSAGTTMGDLVRAILVDEETAIEMRTVSLTESGGVELKAPNGTSFRASLEGDDLWVRVERERGSAHLDWKPNAGNEGWLVQRVNAPITPRPLDDRPR